MDEVVVACGVEIVPREGGIYGDFVDEVLTPPDYAPHHFESCGEQPMSLCGSWCRVELYEQEEHHGMHEQSPIPPLLQSRAPLMLEDADVSNGNMEVEGEGEVSFRFGIVEHLGMRQTYQGDSRFRWHFPYGRCRSLYRWGLVRPMLLYLNQGRQDYRPTGPEATLQLDYGSLAALSRRLRLIGRSSMARQLLPLVSLVLAMSRIGKPSRSSTI